VSAELSVGMIIVSVVFIYKGFDFLSVVSINAFVC
jgi:hypothetical protein